MLLAEAIREKEYIEKVIARLQIFIGMSCISINRYNVDAKIKELDELYKKHQQLSVKIDRAKAISVIKINNTELTISDAIVIKDTMEKKLADYEKMLNDVALFNSRQPSNTIDLDYIYKSMETAAIDAKHLENTIQRAMWDIEV
jgi:hypothetical protein